MKHRCLLIALFFTAACETRSKPSEPAVSPTPTPTPTPAIVTDAAPAIADAAAGGAPAPGPAVARPDAALVAPLATASNALGFDLWAATARKQPGIAALSPASISLALTMTWAGAAGETATAMGKTLHATQAARDQAASWGALSATLQGPGSGIELRIANRLYGEQSFPFLPSFLELTQSAFGAPLEATDFHGGSTAARTRINDWVAAQTNQRITGLIPVGALTADTRLVLVNAIYFLADWLTPFPKAGTRDAMFFTSKTASQLVATMNAQQQQAHAKLDGLAVLELPYQGETTSMLIVLPDARDGLSAIEAKLDATRFAAWRTALQPAQVNIALPRFEIDPAAALALAKPLQQLGMGNAFTDAADFSGMIDAAKTSERLKISDVFHKAFVKVDEKGTEAAAATAVVMAKVGSAAQPPSPPPVVFKADHPFLFFVVDRASGLILFMGRVVDPR